MMEEPVVVEVVVGRVVMEVELKMEVGLVLEAVVVEAVEVVVVGLDGGVEIAVGVEAVGWRVERPVVPEEGGRRSEVVIEVVVLEGAVKVVWVVRVGFAVAVRQEGVLGKHSWMLEEDIAT